MQAKSSAVRLVFSGALNEDEDEKNSISAFIIEHENIKCANIGQIREPKYFLDSSEQLKIYDKPHEKSPISVNHSEMEVHLDLGILEMGTRKFTIIVDSHDKKSCLEIDCKSTKLPMEKNINDDAGDI